MQENYQVSEQPNDRFFDGTKQDFQIKESETLSDEALQLFLRERALRTWNSINRLFQSEENNFFPADRVRFTETKNRASFPTADTSSPIEISSFYQTKPTNIGLGLLSFLAAKEIGQLETSEAERRIKIMLDSLKNLDRFEGFFFDWYDARSKKLLTHWPDDGHELDLFLSSVDNAWLALALLIVAQAIPTLANYIQAEFLDQMDFDFFFDKERGELLGGYSVSRNEYTHHHYPRSLVSEPRIVHWAHAALCNEKLEKIEILKRLLNEQGEIPSTLAGGALFELLMPRLLIREKHMDSVLQKLFDTHYQYGLSYLNGLVGLSVADNPNDNDRYTERGVGGTYRSDTVISSHGAVLALLVNPKVAIQSLTTLEEIPEFFNEFGYKDAADIVNKIPTHTQVFIDQAMVLLGLVGCENESLTQLFSRYFTDEEELVFAGM